MMENHYTGSYLPANLNVNCTTNSNIVLDAVQTELINEELEYQNHRLQKNLLHQENNVRRYWQNENDKQAIVNNEWNKYNYLQQDERWFLQNNIVWRDKDKFYYHPNQNSDVISGTKDEIELEISSRNTFNLHFVDDLNNIKDIRFDTLCVSLKSLDVATQNIYDPNLSHGLVNSFSEKLFNNFVSTKYLNERFTDYSLNENHNPTPTLYFIQNITTYKDQMFLANRMGKHFKHLKSSNTTVLVHNQDVANLLWNSVIRKIYGKHNVKVLDDEMLDKESVEQILDKTLCIKIDFIPEDLEKQAKLRELITSVSIGYDRVQFFITLEEANPFLEDFLSASNIIFLDSMQNIIKKMRVQDKIDFTRQIEFNSDIFAKELSAIGLYSLDEYDYNNDIERQKYLDIISKTNNNCLSLNNILDPFDDNFENLIPIIERYKHCYITGQTGSGKSELLKTLILRDILRGDGSVVLLEPHGDLSEQVAKLVKDKTRLVYIDPFLGKNKTPTINLFHLEDKSEANIARVTQIILNVLKGINSDESFSGTMEDHLEMGIRILLRKGNCSFKDLYRLYNDARNEDLVEFGKNSPNQLESEFFKDDFESSKPTKDAVRRRLKKLLNDPIFSNLMNGNNTIDLEKEMNTKGNVILFNIPKGKMTNTYKYYIRFIVEYIQILALKRADLKESKRVHTNLYIDEAHNFITSSATISEILTESRKYKLFITFAHQAITQIKDTNLRDIITTMTNVKIIGKNSNKTLEAINRTLNTKLEDVETLETGEFYLSAGSNSIIKINNTDKLLEGKEDISDMQWEDHKQYQLENYYRSTKVFNFDESIDEFVKNLLSESIDIKYFEPLEKYPEKYAEFLYNFFDDENGRFIAQPEMSFYFIIIYPEADVNDNKLFLSELRSRYEVFKQKPKDHKKYNDKFRYKLL